jgi:hypothetical protein
MSNLYARSVFFTENAELSVKCPDSRRHEIHGHRPVGQAL